MRIYFAGAAMAEARNENLLSRVRNRLVSFHYLTPSQLPFYFPAKKKKKRTKENT